MEVVEEEGREGGSEGRGGREGRLADVKGVEGGTARASRAKWRSGGGRSEAEITRRNKRNGSLSLTSG